MGWIYIGGGWYENEDTGEHVHGRANLPVDDKEDITPTGIRLPCMTCHKTTMHTPRNNDSTEWAFYTCSECSGKTRVRL